MTIVKTNVNPDGLPSGPLDVWFKFDVDDDETPSHEANTYLNEDYTFRVEWCHTGVGLISTEEFQSYADAVSWLASNGYDDFTAIED